MTTTAGHQCHETEAAGARRWQLRMMRLVFAGGVAVAMLALFDAARPDTTSTVLGSGTVRLTDVGVQLTPPNLSGGGFAADDGDDQAQQEAQLQEQLALQQMQQAEQQAEEQNEQAQQQAQQAEQQGQWVEQHPGP